MTTTGVEYSIEGSSSSSIDISRAKELILLDLVKEMCIGKVAKLQSWRGGGATKVVAVHGSTGKNESKSVRHESRAHMLQHMQLLSELHSSHTQGALEGMLHFLALQSYLTPSRRWYMPMAAPLGLPAVHRPPHTSDFWQPYHSKSHDPTTQFKK